MDEKKLDRLEEEWIKEGSKVYDQDVMEVFRLARSYFELINIDDGPNSYSAYLESKNLQD